MKMVIERTNLMAYQTHSFPSGELQINQLQLLQSDSSWVYPHMGYTQPSQKTCFATGTQYLVMVILGNFWVMVINGN